MTTTGTCGGARHPGTCPDCAEHRADCCTECGCCEDCGPCVATPPEKRESRDEAPCGVLDPEEAAVEAGSEWAEREWDALVAVGGIYPDITEQWRPTATDALPLVEHADPVRRRELAEIAASEAAAHWDGLVEAHTCPHEGCGHVVEDLDEHLAEHREAEECNSEEKAQAEADEANAPRR